MNAAERCSTLTTARSAFAATKLAEDGESACAEKHDARRFGHGIECVGRATHLPNYAVGNRSTDEAHRQRSRSIDIELTQIVGPGLITASKRAKATHAG